MGCEVIECKRFIPLPNWFELMNEGDRTFAQQDTNMAEMKDMWTLSNPDVNTYYTPASQTAYKFYPWGLMSFHLHPLFSCHILQ